MSMFCFRVIVVFLGGLIASQCLMNVPRLFAPLLHNSSALILTVPRMQCKIRVRDFSCMACRTHRSANAKGLFPLLRNFHGSFDRAELANWQSTSLIPGLALFDQKSVYLKAEIRWYGPDGVQWVQHSGNANPNLLLGNS